MQLKKLRREDEADGSAFGVGLDALFELVGDDRLIAVHPCIVTRFDDVGITRSGVPFGTVVFQMTPDEIDAGVEYGRGTIAEMMEMAGFRGNLALLDRKTGKITSITLWESEEAMKTSEERANAMRSSGASAIDGSVVSVDRYEVGYFIQP